MKNKKMALLHSVIALLLCVSMLVGSTFAWFTDSVKTGINTIAAGVLDVELYHSNAAVQNEQVNSNTKLFMDLQGSPILWEPGVVSFENLRVANAGDLALSYQLALATDNENYIIDGNNQYGLSQILQVGIVEGGITATDRDGVVGAVTEWTTLASFLRSGSLLAAGEETWGVVVYWQPGEDDNRWNLNNGKTLSGGETLQIDLGIKLIATQEMEESDSIDKTYDENAKAEFFDGFQGGSAGAVVTADDQGITTAEVAMKGGDVSAVVPAGVKVAEGVGSLGLSVTKKAAPGANIQVGENDEMRVLDVHMEGVAQGNTVPMLITLKHYLSTGINTGALKLYHVENGQPVAMTQVANPVNHNEFSYDPATGDVTLAMASFSDVAVVANVENPWNGTVATAFAGGSGTKADPYLIANADQLAYFRDLVDGKKEKEGLNPTFDGKFVKLNNHIYLNNVNFDPIGWGYENKDWNVGDVAGKPFKGTFDGGKNIIFNLYQNGWDLTNDVTGEAYTYTNCGFGLFAAAANATFKDLTIYGADIRVECVETGILVGLSQGNCTYENINIERSKVANYQRPTGGLIGEVSPLNGGGTTTIKNVVIGADVVVGSLWGDFDAPCGGVIGARWDDSNTTEVHMDGVKVHCRMDVYSDVTSAYQWYAYRRAGMLIGNTEQTDPKNQHLAYADFLYCENVEVCYGDWVNYDYYQFTNQDNAWCNNYPWVRAEVGENCSAYSNPRYGQPVVNSVKITTQELAEAKKTGYVEIPFNQLYGGGQGVYGQPHHDGVDVVNYRYSITYMNDGKVLSVKYITQEGAVSTANAPAQHLVELWAEEEFGKGKYDFDGWMNAGSTRVENIDKDNKNDIILYPHFDNPYTARFVDLDGNVLAWGFFNSTKSEVGKAEEKANELLPPQDETLVKFAHWEVHYYKDGSIQTEIYAASNFLGGHYTTDVTIYPVYRYNGKLNLEPVDSDGDGKTNYYKVVATATLDVDTKIPGNVLGIQVKVVEKLYENENNTDYASRVQIITIEEGVEQLGNNSLAYTSALSTVRLPSTITSLGKNAFSRNYKDDTKVITIEFNGTMAEWQEILDDPNTSDDWHNGLRTGTTVRCSDGYYQLNYRDYSISDWYEYGTYKWTAYPNS